MNNTCQGEGSHEVFGPETDWTSYGFDTRQVRAGELIEQGYRAAVTPIYLTAAYEFESFQNGTDRFTGVDSGKYYSRQTNPTNEVAERRIAALESGIGAFVTASGQAAINITVLTLAEHGERIVSTGSVYSGTKVMFDRTFKRYGVSVDYVWNPNDEAEWDSVITPETRAIFTESIPNPKNDVVDIALLSRVAKRHGLPLIVDNTLATPYLLRPIEHGADIVIHSSTKFLTGHGAAISGIVVDGGSFDWLGAQRRYSQLQEPVAPNAPSYAQKFGSAAFLAAARQTILNDTGAALSPFHGFLLQQGVETLSLRVEQHVKNAQAIACWLDVQPLVESVDYAGLPSHPQHQIAQRYYGGRSGSVFAFTVKGGRAGAELVFDSLKVFKRMTNLGDVRSLVLHPASTTNVSMTDEENTRLGITQGLIRLSVGIETVDDLINDLDQALKRAEQALLSEQISTVG